MIIKLTKSGRNKEVELKRRKIIFDVIVLMCIVIVFAIATPQSLKELDKIEITQIVYKENLEKKSKNDDISSLVILNSMVSKNLGLSSYGLGLY